MVLCSVAHRHVGRQREPLAFPFLEGQTAGSGSCPRLLGRGWVCSFWGEWPSQGSGDIPAQRAPWDGGLPESSTPSSWFPQLGDSLPGLADRATLSDFGWVDTSVKGRGLPCCGVIQDSATLWPCFFVTQAGLVGPGRDTSILCFPFWKCPLLLPSQGQARSVGKRGLGRAAGLPPAPWPPGATGTQWKLKEAP